MKQKSFYKVPDEARCPRIKPCFLCLSLSIQQCPGGSHLLIVKMAPVSLEINMHTVLLFKRITLFSLLLVEMVSTYLDVQRGYQKTRFIPQLPLVSITSHRARETQHSRKPGIPRCSCIYLCSWIPFMHESWEKALLCNTHN